MALVICANYAWLAKRNPGTGGSFIYTRNILGEDHAFLAAWSLELAYISLLWANSSAFILIGRYIFGGIFQWGFLYKFAGYDVYLGEVYATIAIQVLLGMVSNYAKKLA